MNTEKAIKHVQAEVQGEALPEQLPYGPEATIRLLERNIRSYRVLASAKLHRGQISDACDAMEKVLDLEMKLAQVRLEQFQQNRRDLTRI